MTFSLVIPSYNGAAYIDETILSVLSQTRPFDEIILSDDNSSDETLQICRKYSDRIRICSNPKGPSGFVNGWNNAIELSTSEYVSILHQDDLLSPNFLENIEIALSKHPQANHIFTSCNYINNTGDIIREPREPTNEIKLYSGLEYIKAYQKAIISGPIHLHRCPGVVNHKNVYKSILYNSAAGHIADDDFFYRVAKFGCIVGIDKPLSSYRMHSISETGNLVDSELVARLSNDYIFQLKQSKSDEFFDKDAYDFFKDNAVKFTRRLFYYGLLRRNISMMNHASHNFMLIRSEFNFLPNNIKYLVIVIYYLFFQKKVKPL